MKIQYKIWTNKTRYSGESELTHADLKRSYDFDKELFILKGPNNFYCECETKEQIKEIMYIIWHLETGKSFQYYADGLCDITNLSFKSAAICDDDETCDPESSRSISCK